jgi:hypothetical protein
MAQQRRPGGLTAARTPTATLLVGAALTIFTIADARAHTPGCNSARCEWRCDKWQVESSYRRCIARCLGRQRCPLLPIADPYLPNDDPEDRVWRPAERVSPADLTVLGLLGIGVLILLVGVIGRAIRGHALRLSMDRVRRAEAHLAQCRTEVFRRIDEL